MNIAIAEYAKLERAGVRIYYFPEDAAGAARAAQKSEAAIELLTRWLGPLPRAPQFTLIEIPDGMGSQADLNAGIIQTAAAFRSVDSLQELYHELSHFWNVPDLDAPSPRWNEGLAMYMQRKVATVLDGYGGMAERARLTATRLVKRAAEDPRLASVPFERYGSERMTDYAYSTGFLMFYALEKRIGEEALRRTVHEYGQRFASSGAGLAELTRVASEVSGQDLTRFFDAWLRTTGWLEALRTGRPVAEVVGTGNDIPRPDPRREGRLETPTPSAGTPHRGR